MINLKLRKDDFEAWQANPVTETVMGLLRKQASDIRGQWADGMNWTDSARCEVGTRENIAGMSYEEFMEELETHFGEESDEA